MAVDNINVIDAISINPEGDVVLTIADHLEWDIEKTHLLILQEKINSYLDILQNGQIYDYYPKAKGKKIVIQLIVKYMPDNEGLKFIEIIRNVLSEIGYTFTFYQQ